MVAGGYGAVDRVAKAGDTMTGSLVLGGSPPVNVPGATSGQVLVSDGSGNMTPQAQSGGGGSGTALLVQVGPKTADYTASANQIVLVSTASNAVTITLPAAPANGTINAVKMVTQGTGNNTTVQAGGSDVINLSGGSTSAPLKIPSQGILLQYDSGIWAVLGDDLPLTQLDARYVLVSALPLAVASGGTGQASLQASMNALAQAITAGLFLRGNGTNVVMAAIQAGDVPTLNQSTTGTAASVTGTVALANGGTGQTTRQAALNALAGAVTSGQYPRGNGTSVVMAAIQAADLPTATTSAQGAVQLDGTAGDMQPLGAASAGSSGEAADAKHAHPSSSATAFTSAVVALTYASSIAVNASLGNHFRVTMTGNATLANPTSGTDGQKITVEVIQDSTGGRTLAYGTAYAFGTTIPQPVLTTTASKRDFLAFLYNSGTGLWYCVGFLQSF